MRQYLISFMLPAIATAALAGEPVTVTKIKAPDLPLPSVIYPGGKTLNLNLGIGSAAWRDPKDPPGVIWAITDRGPNLDCAGIEEPTGLGIEKLCAGDDKAKNFPVPEFTPTIVKLEIAGDTAKLLETVPLKGKSGTPLTGLPFTSGSLKLEAAYDVHGKVLAGDPSGLDTEALVRLPNGSFVIGEEYGSSLAEVSGDGTVSKRYVPAGLEGDLAGADYEVVGSLPALIAKRALNRGIENVALSADGAYFYVLMQNPLANPDNDAFKKSANTRLWKIESATGNVAEQYLYVLDDATTFRADNKKEAQKQNAVRLSRWLRLAMTALSCSSGSAKPPSST